MLRTRTHYIAMALTAVIFLATGCSQGGVLSKVSLGAADKQAATAPDLSKVFGQVDQKVQVGGGWAVLSPAKAGGARELGFVSVTSGKAKEAGARQTIADAADAKLTVDGSVAVIETAKDGAPQYAAYKAGTDGLQAVDYYALHAPAAPTKTGHSLVVNKHLNVLWHFNDGQLVQDYRVATGRQTTGPAPTWQDYATNYFTPEGTFKVIDFRMNPVYKSFVPGHEQVFEGGDPNSPIGTRWMGFGVLDGDAGRIWGIHGTNEPDKLGTWVSDGCIRLQTKQVEELYSQLNGHDVTLTIVAG